MSVIFVINSGFLLLKYSLIDIEQENLFVSGFIECIGQEVSLVLYIVCLEFGGGVVFIVFDVIYCSECLIVDYVVVFEIMCEQFVMYGLLFEWYCFVVVGYCVVYGGVCFYVLMFIDVDVEWQIDELVVFVLLYNFVNFVGICVV